VRDFVEQKMELTLTYSGPLPACQDADKHTEQKQKIRLAFSRQLEKKFTTEPTLMQWSDSPQGCGLMAHTKVISGAIVWDCEQEKHQACFYEAETCGFRAVPIVTSHNGLGCQLDVEILRRARAGGVMAGGDRGGDIDNRLKPLLDALALPMRPNQIPGPLWGKGERLYCLLEDDALVSRLMIDIQRWDEDPATPAEQDDVQLRIKASIQPCEPRIYHAGF
jgi:hypothetical protein